MAWSAFERVRGPILIHERLEAMLAQVCAILASAFGKRSYKPSEFLPEWDSRPKRQTPEEMIAIFRQLTGTK